ncbi:MAG: hypothetical protein M3083_12320 [Actinomycetota bacterium]|nr:hypothetical protein [Actinomycetota bacterium]
MSEHVKREPATGALVAAARTTCQAVSDSADEHLAVIDDLVRGLQAATGKYRHQPLEWSDVASLSEVRDQLDRAVKRFSSAETIATTHRAARQVASDLHRLRQMEQAD